MVRLPILDVETDLTARLRETPRVVLSAPTGSGKSTQVPRMLLRNGFLASGQAVILQPRRLATRLLARRVAEESGTTLGREVGYQIRFENVSGAETRIKFVTEGVLLRQMLDDPDLKGVAALVFDEFHERHLYGDISLARALELQALRRPDLVVIVMSATLDIDAIEAYLRPCAVIQAGGRTHPIEIEFANRPSYTDSRPIWEQAADAFGDLVARGGEGDTLIFMPGAFEIQRTLETLRGRSDAKGRVLLPLHGELSPREQDAAVARYDRPKIVVATNVAETSITIEGVRWVIDSGLARIARHDPARGINTLLVEEISRASAAQRAGRAGRTEPGVCVRLWSFEEHGHRPAKELPEVKRLDLAEVVLTLKAAGIDQLTSFRWLEPPDPASLRHAEQLLLDLGALESSDSPASPGTDPGATPTPTPTRITKLGRRMLAFPVHPRYARLLLAAQECGCVVPAAMIAALSQVRDLFVRRVDRDTARSREDRIGDRANSDFLLLMKAWDYAAAQDFQIDACQRVGIHAATARQVAPLLDQFLRLAEREGFDISKRDWREADLRRCLLAAFSDQVARRVDTGTLRCELVHGRRGTLARESAVQDSPLFVAAEVRDIGGRGGEVATLLSLATAIDPEWLTELFPSDITKRVRVAYDGFAKRVAAEEQVVFRGLPIETRRLEPPPEDAAATLLAEEVLAGRLTLLEWDHGVEQWILRLNNLARWCPDLELPPVTDADRKALVEQVCHGACGYRDIKDRAVKPIVHAWLNDTQRAWLDKHAPERLELSNGKKPKVTYSSENPPFVALRIQELYGVLQTPRIAMNRVPVTVQILAPSMRPVQVTQDLASFWQDHYPRVKSELQRKYPKHEWR